jgi:hypothetical protein
MFLKCFFSDAIESDSERRAKCLSQMTPESHHTHLIRHIHPIPRIQKNLLSLQRTARSAKSCRGMKYTSIDLRANWSP